MVAKLLGAVSEGGEFVRIRRIVWHEIISRRGAFPRLHILFLETAGQTLTVKFVRNHLRTMPGRRRVHGVWVDPTVEEYDYGRVSWTATGIESSETLPKNGSSPRVKHSWKSMVR